MIPVLTLYDEYIDRPKLTEQTKPFEYIVPSPSRGVGTIIRFIADTPNVKNVRTDLKTFAEIFTISVMYTATQKHLEVLSTSLVWLSSLDYPFSR